MTKTFSGVCNALVAIILIATAASASGLAPNTALQVVVKKDILVPMRDGVRLALDLYFPARDGIAVDERLPTLLARTPYNKDGTAAEARWFAARGYAVVVNDVRGRYASEGAWRMLLDDPNDGYDVLEWIAKQPWSTGRVGTFGTSYVGGPQHALAVAHHQKIDRDAAVAQRPLGNLNVGGVVLNQEDRVGRFHQVNSNSQ